MRIDLTRMECKGSSPPFPHPEGAERIDLTRMECKDVGASVANGKNQV